MGVPEARLNRSRKGSRLCLNSTRLKDTSSDGISLLDSAPSSPELRSEKGKSSSAQSAELDSPKTLDTSFQAAENSPAPLVAPVASFYNLGNTCFMNCMLHVLRYTPEFLQLLANVRDEIDKEEKTLGVEETKTEKSSARLGWQLLRNMHDMYTEMSLKEFQYRELMPSNSGIMALRPYPLLESIRLLNPLFEGNMQHDAQELLRCLLCGVDDAELDLRRIKQKRQQEQENRKQQHPCSGDATGSKSLGPATVIERREEGDSIEDVADASSKKPTVIGERRQHKKKNEVSQASKGILASFLKAKEVPGIVTKVDQQQEPFEGTGLDKNSDMNLVGAGEMKVNIEESQISSTFTSTVSAPSSPCSISSSENSSVSDVIFCGESSIASSASPHFESRRLISNTPSLSLTQETYLNSVKHTEGRRSRLGVRGKARAVVISDNKLSAPSNCALLDECQNGSASNLMDVCEENNFKTQSSNGFDRIQSSPKEADYFALSKTGSPLCGASKSPSHVLPHATDEEIVESPSSISNVENSPGRKSKEKLSSSPMAKPDIENPQDGKFSHIVLTPGKDITIHSPLSNKPTFYTPPLPKSRNFLSRLGNFLPNSAKRFLTFSSEDAQPAKLLGPNVLLPHSAADSSKKTSLPLASVSSESPLNDSTKNQFNELLQEAHIQLRRCDWLGVSPVKSISASYVMRQISDSEEDSASMVCEKEEQSSTNQNSQQQQQTKSRKRLHDGKLVSSVSQETNREKCETDIQGQNENLFSLSENVTERKPQENISAESDYPSRVKRFKSSEKNCPDGIKKEAIKEPIIDSKRLPKLSISLEKCDWLINSGKKSVKISKARSEGRETKRRECISQIHEVNLRLRKQCTGRRNTELLSSPVSLSAGLRGELPSSSSSSTGPTIPRLAYNLFGGTMSHQTRCCECEAVSDRPEEFLDISIPVPKTSSCSGKSSDDEACGPDDQSVSLLLQSLASREKIYGENKYFCENCHHLVEAERSSHVTSLPKVLALHLKRFHANSSAYGGVSKISDHVAVPRHLPCLLHKCPLAKPTCQHRYSLYAVVTHSGASIRHGHYRTYVRVPHSFNGQISDFRRNQGREVSSPCSFGDVSSNFPICDTSSISSETKKETSLVDNLPNSAQFLTNGSQESSSALAGAGAVSRMDVDGEKDFSNLSWWLECDDDFVQVLDESEFFGKLSQTDGSLLGTPYVLFYHR